MADVINLKRRWVLSGGCVLLAAPLRVSAIAGPPPIPSETVAICREIRRRHTEVRALVSYELSLEGEPGHAAAEQKAFNPVMGRCVDKSRGELSLRKKRSGSSAMRSRPEATTETRARSARFLRQLSRWAGLGG